MPKLAAQPQWRSRRAAIGKKGAADFELLMESEVDFTMPCKEPQSVTNSPTSVASTHLELSPVPEMKPLPGAWITVGKGGRPVSMIGTSMLNPNAAAFVPAFYPIEDGSNEAKHVDDILRTMHHLVSVHDSEQLMLAKQFADADLVDDLEEEEESSSMSSKCILAMGRSAMQREKALNRAKDAKYWRKYQQAKHLKVLARDTLIAALADSGSLGEIDEGADNICVPQPLPRRNDKGSSHGAKARRKARFASAAARCHSFEDEDEMPPVQVERSVRTKVSKSVKTEPRTARSEGRSELQMRALKRERAAKTEEESEGSSADVKLPSASPAGEPKMAKRQSGEGEGLVDRSDLASAMEAELAVAEADVAAAEAELAAAEAEVANAEDAAAEEKAAEAALADVSAKEEAKKKHSKQCIIA